MGAGIHQMTGVIDSLEHQEQVLLTQTLSSTPSSLEVESTSVGVLRVWPKELLVLVPLHSQPLAVHQHYH